MSVAQGSGRRPGAHGSILTMIAIAAAAILVTATPAAAFTWTRTTLRTASGLSLRDVAFDGHDVAILWQEPGPTSKLRISGDDGTSFSSTVTLASTRQATVAMCDGVAHVAVARDYSGPWHIDYAAYGRSGLRVDQGSISGSSGTARYPDIACAGGRLFVAWEERVGGQWHVLVSHAPAGAPAFPVTPLDLGPVGANAGHVAVAGASDRAYVAWPTPAGALRIHTWGVGSGPGFAVSDLGERDLASSGAIPRIAAQGAKVSVAWYDCGDIRARVSTNRGGAWGTIRTVFTGACGSEFGGVPQSIALHGGQSVIAYHWFQGYDSQRERMITTNTDFTTRTDRVAYAGADGFVLGYAVPGGAATLAGAVDEGSVLRFLREP